MTFNFKHFRIKKLKFIIKVYHLLCNLKGRILSFQELYNLGVNHMNKNKIRIMSLLLLFSLISFLNLNNYNNSDTFETDSLQLKTSSSLVNGNPLLVTQHANTSNSFLLSSLPTNVSFTLAQGWISKNITINYEGVAFENNTVPCGEFESQSEKDEWIYQTNAGSELIDKDWTSSYGNPPGCVEIEIKSDPLGANDYGYYEQTIYNEDNFDPNYLATISMNYYYDTQSSSAQSDVCAFLEVEIGGVKSNKTIEFFDNVQDAWASMDLTYDPSAMGQTLPNEIKVRAGVFVQNSVTPSNTQYLRIDNIKYKIWSSINEPDLIVAYDNDYNKNYTYNNIAAGKGTTIVDVERSHSLTSDVIFTISKNNSYSDEFNVKDIVVSSECIKLFNSTYGGFNGSYYSTDGNINWNTEFSISIPYNYIDNWAEVVKTSDWAITSVLDGYNTEQIGSCSGVGIGFETSVIPKGTLTSGLWRVTAISQNYINMGKLGVWNGTIFNEQSLLTINDIFQLDITLNDTISLTNSQLNCTIKYPNGTIFWQDNKEPPSPVVTFGNFTAGTNMSVGDYQVIVEWTNNISSTSRNKVGYDEFTFSVWHRTNLTAVDPYFEMIAGDPLILKVKFMDSDLNDSIDFAKVTYNSTFGALGTMIYIGSGEYFIDLDTSSLLLGDYFFSFNASKLFYENQTMENLIHLKIVAQPLDLEVPHYALEGNANSIISCKINVTGAITRTLIYPANISTDWFNSYNITDHNNGTYTLDFSTFNIPTSGYLESYDIEISANKTNYGNTNEFITLLVHPISTVAKVNISLVTINSNEIVNLKVNYTIENSNDLIFGSNCTVTWQGSSLINPVSDGFDIKLFTSGLLVDYYSVLIKLEKAGFEVAFESVTIIIIEQEVNLTVSINSEELTTNSLIDSYFQQAINISARVYAVFDEEFLSGGLITLMSNNYQKNFTELPSTYFSTSLILDGANFNSGINNIFLRFEQANYTTKIFPFQLFIRAQNVNLSTQINYREIHDGYLYQQSFNQGFHLSCRAFADIEGVFLSGGKITFINGEYEVELYENADYWFNQTILISTSTFSIGPNYAYLEFQQNNYSTTIFAFQVFVNQLEIDVDILGFEGFISGTPGETVLIRLNLTELGSSNYIENATVFYSWIFGVGYFDYVGSGIYELELRLPTGFGGNYDCELIITKEGIMYKTKEFTFIIDINQVEGPNIFIWILIFSLIAITGILGVLSLRSYVILPKRRKRESDLLSKVQVFKDVWNIRAVILIHKESGLPIYSEEISVEKDHDSFLISGFVQAITAFSETFVEKEFRAYRKLATDYEYLKTIIDLDFKFFQLLVCDYETIRVLLILRDTASERLKSQLYLLAVAINSQFSEELRKFTGNVGNMKNELQDLLNQFLFLHYSRTFEITSNTKYINSILDSGELTKLERRLIHVISSMNKINKRFTLRAVIDLIEEKNEDLILEALSLLILRNIILSPYSTKLSQEKQRILEN